METWSAISTGAQFSTGSFSSSFNRCIAPRLTYRRAGSCKVRCALFPLERRESRRLVSISLVCLRWISAPQNAVAAGFDRYLKRKKLEPLEAYVPAIILTEMQIKELGKTLEADEPQYAAYRSLLRSGPAASLRVNIRAVAQYASDSGNEKTASNNVDQCLRALEDLDSLLLNASRKDPQASVQSMQSKIGIAVGALDSLLQTVPSDVLVKGKAIADAYNIPEEDVPPETLDPNLKQLESIL